MNVETTLTAIGNDVKVFYAKLAADLQKARQAWLMISSAQTRNVLLTIGSDAIRLVKDAGSAVETKGLSMTLDGAVLSDLYALVNDARTGDAVVVADLKALGIVL